MTTTPRTQAEHQAVADRIAARLAADSRTAEWNPGDGGAGALAFIRAVPALSRRTPEQVDADRRAQALAILARMGR